MISAAHPHTLLTPITYHGLAIHSGSLGLTGGDRARTDERVTGETRSGDEAQHSPGHDYWAYGRASVRFLHFTNFSQITKKT